jgi:hypothetical protein
MAAWHSSTREQQLGGPNNGSFVRNLDPVSHADWLQRVPDLVAQCRKEWGLRLGEPYFAGAAGYTVRAQLPDVARRSSSRASVGNSATMPLRPRRNPSGAENSSTRTARRSTRRTPSPTGTGTERCGW